MKITDIEIERFGVWQNLALRLTSSGMNVFYGPNEAGKSTLMRFIRGVLYGFPSLSIESSALGSGRPNWEGTLRVDHRGQRCAIHRPAQSSGRGPVSVSGTDGKASADQLLAELLAGTNRRMFDSVFAIGLHELQELATLDHDEVAQHIYGMTLGPEGQRLLDASSRIETEVGRLFDPREQNGEFADVFGQFERLSAEIVSSGDPRERHQESCRDRDLLEVGISEIQANRERFQSALRGHVFLERVWPLWNQVRELESELDQSPTVVAFPENASAKLDEIDLEIATATNCRDNLTAEALDFCKQADALHIDPQIQAHAATMQTFVDQSDWLRQISDKVTDAVADADRLKSAMDEQITELDDEWSLERLEAVDTSAAAQYGLMQAARSYRSALSRRSRLQERIERLSKTCHRRSQELSSEFKKLGGRTIEEAIDQAREQISRLGKLARLRLQEAEFQYKQDRIASEVAQLGFDERIPRWAPWTLGAFGVVGVVLAIIGVISSVTVGLVAGTIYASLGIMSGGLFWGLRQQLMGKADVKTEELENKKTVVEVHLRAIRKTIARLTEDPTAENTAEDDADSAPVEGQRASDTELIAEAAMQLPYLEQLQAQSESNQTARDHLADHRKQFQTVQHDTQTARENWCASLQRCGLPEMVRIDAAFTLWQQVMEAGEQRRAWLVAQRDLAHFEEMFESFGGRIDELDRQIHGLRRDDRHPLDVLADWEEQLELHDRAQTEQLRLRREETSRREEAAGYQSLLHEFETQRSALFVQAGASSRDEFDQRARWHQRRCELEQLLEMAKTELEGAARTEPEIAIVEEDLVAYNPDRNQDIINSIKLELEEAEHSLGHSFEQLGRIRQEIEILESDRAPTSRRFERSLALGRLKGKAEEWFAANVASKTVARIKQQFERDCQPEILAAASPILERLTCGKFRHVWAPLGQRQLYVDDDQGRKFTVDQLSGGTREQLFLAVRLAMIQNFSREGVELPMVLDDIIVNFDQLRTEAAADVLLEFAEKGQQILLFTCHLHLAHMFESKGVEPIWLPGHNPPMEERRAG